MEWEEKQRLVWLDALSDCDPRILRDAARIFVRSHTGYPRVADFFVAYREATEQRRSRAIRRDGDVPRERRLEELAIPRDEAARRAREIRDRMTPGGPRS